MMKGLLVILIFIFPQVHAASRVLEEGKDYYRLSAAIAENPQVKRFSEENVGKIKIIEFLSYGCYGCQRLDPILSQWAKKLPSHVVFRRVPIMFHPGWDVLAKAFYVAETLNKSETWDPLVFQALHTQRRNLSQEAQLIDFFKEQGLAETEFKHIYHSFSMDQEIKRAQALAAGYRISVSPVVVVHTPHAIFQTNAVMIQSEEGLPEVIEQLIQMR